MRRVLSSLPNVQVSHYCHRFIAAVGIGCLVSACSSGVPLSPYSGKRGGQGNGGYNLPTDSGSGAGTAASGEARFVQSGQGAVYLPLLGPSYNISGGNLYANMTPQSLEITLSGLTADRSANGEVRNSVQASNGTSRFARILFADLPKDAKYTNHPYLMFASSGSNPKGELFTVVDGNPFPVFPFAKSSRESYANIEYGAQTYNSLISFAGQTRSVTFQVSRRAGNVLGNCKNNYYSPINLLLGDPNYLALEMIVYVPDEWKGKFPVNDSAYVISFASGGTISHIGACNILTYNKPGDARGAIVFAAQP